MKDGNLSYGASAAIVIFIAVFFGILPLPARAATPQYAVQVFDAKGTYLSDLVPSVTPDAIGNLDISFPKKTAFRPGAYLLRVYVVKNGVVYVSDSSFRWGVIALNFNKSVYSLNAHDEARIEFGVLNDHGSTICDSDAQLSVDGPKGQHAVFTTANGSIKKSPDCSDHSVTNNPDYSAVFTPRSVGAYHVSLIAGTGVAVRKTSSDFTVEDSPLFNVERDGPTRIYPPSRYRVNMKIIATQDFSGIVVETVPSSFGISQQGMGQDEVPMQIATFAGESATGTLSSQILRQNLGGQATSSATTADTETITWNATLKAGKSYQFWYVFKAPDVSPQFYLTGPLAFTPTGAPSVLWQESRQWQIAADGFVATVVFITATSTTSWSTPSDWNSASNTVEVIGAGSGSGRGGTHAGGGGGGAYAKTSNINVSGSVTVRVGSSTSNTGVFASATWFNGSGTNCDNAAASVCAAGGESSSSAQGGGAGGSAASSTGDTKFAGGAGATATSSGNIGAGGGGAAGPDGAGLSGVGQSGGNGDNGNANGGLGGTIPSGVTNGRAGTSWTQTSDSATDGAGGGGAGGTSGASSGGGGHEGGGAGGFGTANTKKGGQEGIIVITYTPLFSSTTQSRYRWRSDDGSETSASWQVAENTAGTATSTNNVYRLRLELTNLGSTSTAQNYQLQYQASATSGAWTTVPSTSTLTSQVFVMQTSTQSITDGVATTNQLTADGTTFVAGTLQQATSSSGSITLNSTVSTSKFTEVEYAIKVATSTPKSLSGTTYYFRVTAAGTALDAYTISPEIRLQLSQFPRIPILNIPFPGVTTSLTSIIFKMTATDPNADNIQYQQTIYQNQACTQVVENHNQNFSQTGWTGQNASASAEYTSGQTGIFTTTSTLTASTTYYWGASAIDPEGSASFGSSSLTLAVPSWATNANKPGTLSRFSAVAYNGYLYTTGGATTTIEFNLSSATKTVFYAHINSNGTVGTWATTTALPKGLEEHASVAYNGYLYTIGGVTSSIAANGVLNSATTTVFYAPIQSDGTVGTWATTTALPSGLMEHAAVAYNGYLYTIGGTTSTQDRVISLATTTVFYAPIQSDGTVGTWATTTALPSGLLEHTSIAYNGYLYTIGGVTSTISNSATTTIFYAPIQSDGTVGTWNTTTALPSGLLEHTSVAYNGYLYTMGGASSTDIDFISSATTTVSYAPLQSSGTVGTWNQATFLPNPTLEQSAVVSNGYLYLIGGATSTTSRTRATTTVFYAQIDKQGKTANEGWISQTSTPSVLVGHAAVTYNGYLYTIGGATSTASPATTTIFYAAVGASGTVTSWNTNSNALPSPIANHAAVVYGNYLYVTGGSTSTAAIAPATSSIFYAQLQSNGTVGSWSTNATSLPSGIEYHASVANKGYLYTIGGATSTATAAKSTTTVFYAPILSDGTIGTVATTTALPKGLALISAVVLNDYLYVIGGATSTTSNAATTTVFYAPIYPNGTVGTWGNTTNLPIALSSVAATVYNNFLYAVGGCTTPNACSTATNDTTTVQYAQILPLAVGSGTLSSWINASSLPGAAYGTQAVVLNGYLYTLGGASTAVSSIVQSIGLYTSCIAFTPVTAPNAVPSVSAVSLNHGNALVLTPNATTSFDINFTVTDTDGCGDILFTTSTAFRTGVASTCAVGTPTTSSLSCYLRVTNTTSSCISSTQINGTSTVDIYYFADSTGNGSSSYSAQGWEAYVSAHDTANASSSATSTDVNVNVLTAINVSTSSIDYGNVNANANTGATNQNATTTNAGNSSTTLQLYVTATLTLGASSIATSNQVYATSSFTYNVGSTSTAITGSAVTIPDILLTSPTSTATSGYAKATFWGLAVPNGNASGSYTGTTVFQSLFQP